MRKTTLIWIIIAAALIGGGLVTYLIFGRNASIGTQAVPPGAPPGDRDGDGTTDEFDYYPDDPTK